MYVVINREEIEAKSHEFEIHAANVERDYVFGWLLFGIFTASALKDEIFLKGGNALRKGYFANTRFSSDLDFGIPYDISEDALIAEINQVCDFIQERSGVSFLKEENRIKEKFTASEAPIPGLRVYEVRIYFKDFYGQRDDLRIRISMDVTRFDQVLLPIQTVPLIHPYSDAVAVACNVRCMKLEEIIGTKLKCLLQRQHAPDLFDYAYSVKLLGGNLDKQEVVEAFIRKTIFGRNPGVLKNILHQTPMDFFRENWSKTVVCAKQFLFGIEEAIQVFIADLEGLFSAYPDNGYALFVFFKAEFRIPIMKAGREQTLLKIRYNGAERMVEPYSLKYLVKRGGEEHEYFYIYNRSGGNNPPGIRSLLPQGLQSVENTEEKFTPQFPIELSKAGEIPENRYLFDPNRPTKAPRSRIFGSARSTGPKYVYECSYCGRKFTKSKRDSAIGEHKDKSGYRCPGRRGYYVDTKW
jgi:predicted nucleotidyltransferase component of viral defense system